MKAALFLILLFPLLGAFLHAVVGRRLPRRVVEVIACASVGASFVMAILAFLISHQKSYTIFLFTWIGVGDFSAAVSVHYDPLSAIMAVMVTFVSGLIHLYSVSFMRDDEDYVRYFCYLNLFVFAMLVITLADNIVFLYLGWEGVGFCSYALIGFWYQDVVKAAAGRKAFVLTRIGDAAFGVAIGLFFLMDGTLSISHINAHAASLTAGMATTLGLLLLGAAVGKSAQLPLAVWLPDAMAGPTPVSALIHAATMVTAGVYLLMRLFPVVALSPIVLVAIAIVGAFTAFYAACSALAQHDIKRVLAYSTMSQVGYMFLAIGAGDVVGSMFHLLSHACFKAVLFLAAGCIIQALHEEHDIFRMGNLRRHLPGVFWAFLFGALSLGALPPSGGFFSKDRILLAAFSRPEGIYTFIWILAAATAFITPLYTFRLFFLVFLGKPASQREHEIRPVPKVMVWVLWPLAVLSLFSGFLNLPEIWSGKEWLSRYLAAAPGAIPPSGSSNAIEWAMQIGSSLLSLAMVIVAFIMYCPDNILGWSLKSPARQKLHELFFSGFYLDRLYEVAIARPYKKLASFAWVTIDEKSLDNGLEKTGGLFPAFSTGLRQWTTGRLSTYLIMLLLGFTLMVGVFVMSWL